MSAPEAIAVRRVRSTGAMAHANPVAEPARQRRQRYISSQWLGFNARRLSGTVIGDGDDAVKQRKEAVILVEHRQQVGDGHKRGKPDAPAVAMCGRHQRRVVSCLQPRKLALGGSSG